MYSLLIQDKMPVDEMPLGKMTRCPFSFMLQEKTTNPEFVKEFGVVAEKVFFYFFCRYDPVRETTHTFFPPNFSVLANSKNEIMFLKQMTILVCLRHWKNKKS